MKDIIKEFDIVIAKDVISELAIKAMELLEVPLEAVSSASGVYRISKTLLSIPDILFYKKLEKFLKGTKKISDEDKEKFVKKYNEKINESTEKILNIINNIEDNKKIEYFSKLFNCLVIEQIDMTIFFRLSYLVKNVMSEDIEIFLDDEKYRTCKDTLVIESLLKNELIMSADFPSDGTYHEKTKTDIYNLTKIGKLLRETLNNKEV